MKRYWKLAVLIPFIIVSFGIYYIEVAGRMYPEFVLKLEEGNEKEASPLVFQGNWWNQQLYITSEGSDYWRNHPFWEKMGGNNPRLEKLRKEYRNFMRGKNNPYAFFENDQILGYGDIKSDYSRLVQHPADFRFTVSVYDKVRKDTTSFEIEVPKQETYSSLYLYDIRIDGKNMKLFTLNDLANDPKKEAHLYTLDLDKKNVAEDQVIVSAGPPDENTRVGLGGVFPKASAKDTNRLVYQITYTKPEARSKGSKASEAYTLEKRDLFVYDIASGKLELIPSDEMKELLLETAEGSISQTGDDLYITSLKDSKSPRVIKYSLSEKKVKSNLEIDLHDRISDLAPSRYSVTVNNRLYMLYNTRNSTPVAQAVTIAELDSGGIVYKGNFFRKDNKEISNFNVGYFEIH